MEIVFRSLKTGSIPRMGYRSIEEARTEIVWYLMTY